MTTPNYAAYSPANPYFNLIRGALGDLVDGEHFFDIITNETIYEVLYEIGWPRVIRGRNDLMAAFKGYVESIVLQSADTLVVHKTDDGHVIVIEYEVHGTVLATSAKYNNRFCSIITIENRKIAHWRDYMDSLAAWKALTARPAKRQGWDSIRRTRSAPFHVNMLTEVAGRDSNPRPRHYERRIARAYRVTRVRGIRRFPRLSAPLTTPTTTPKTRTHARSRLQAEDSRQSRRTSLALLQGRDNFL
jgi:ketosteroid isomerase-like protein